MVAILVVVVVMSAGNRPEYKYFPFDSVAACERAIDKSFVREPNPDDGRGIQAMFCVQAQK